MKRSWGLLQNIQDDALHTVNYLLHFELSFIYVCFIYFSVTQHEINGKTQWLLQFYYEHAIIIHAYKLFEYLLR